MADNKAVKLIVIIVVAVLLVVVPVIGFVVYRSSQSEQMEDDMLLVGENKQESKELKRKELGPLMIMEGIVNVSDAEATRYLKVTIALELSSSKLYKEMDRRKPEFLDVMLEILRRKSVEDLLKDDGTDIIRKQIKTEFNKRLVSGTVVRVYFTEYLIQ